MKAVLRTDGGARGNPGPAGIGFVLETTDGVQVACGGRFIGEATNNVAEYEALIWGLQVALERDVSEVSVFSDSELLVKQMNGVYRVKHPNMIPLYSRACDLVSKFASAKISHVRREQNCAADALANEAMDLRGTVGNVGEPPPSTGQSALF